MCYVYANLYVSLCEGINCYKYLPKHKTIIEDLDNIIQVFLNGEVSFITKSIHCAHFNERAEKIVVSFYDCSFGEIPIMLYLFGSSCSVCFPLA